MLLSEFHVDGFRVDLTQSFHRDNVIDGNGATCAEANLFGTKFLREWVRTLRLLKPSIILTAEDHTGWRAITELQERGGIGFDAIWWVEWYHHLIGDSQNDSRQARLLHFAGFGANEPLAISLLAKALTKTSGRVIYHESHDLAGNASYREEDRVVHSARTIQTAGAGKLDDDRDWAEARCRVVCGLTVLAPGIPMFFMGEEVGAKEPYRYNDWLYHREDFQALRATTGAKLFEFYRDTIRLRRQFGALRSPHVEVLHVHDPNRVLVFRRWLAHQEFLVFASFSNDILKSKRTAVLWVPPVLSIGEVAERLRSTDVGVMIVSNDGESLQGLVSERDIAHGLAVHGAALLSLKVSDLMARSVITCTSEDSVADIARIMTMRRIRHIPVVDGGKVVGVVSIGDVLKSRISEIELEANVLRDLAVAHP